MTMTERRSRIPPTGLPIGVEAGPLGKRLAAHLIDLLVPAVVIGVSSLAAPPDPAGRAVVWAVAAVLVVLWALLVWRMFAVRAAGPGMRAMKLQLVGLRDGRPVGWARFFGRGLALAALEASVVGAPIMLVMLVQHQRRQGWHDLLAQSVVIKERTLAPPVRAGSARSSGSTGPQAAGSSATASDTEHPPTRSDESVSPRARRLDPDDGPPATEVWAAVFDDGREIEVVPLVLLGRKPQARQGEDDAVLVKVVDDTRTVSKTHLALGTDRNGVYVTDRGSTNGSTVTDRQGVSRSCPAEEVVTVDDGSIVSFGDHWLRITRRS